MERDYSLVDLLRRPELGYRDLADIVPPVNDTEVETVVETNIKYEGYIERQQREVIKLREKEKLAIPPTFDYDLVAGLSHEVREKLKDVRPTSIGMAGRIPGVTPAALSILLVYIHKFDVEKSA